MKINHIALWARDLESLRDFYVRYFGARAGERYHNPMRRFTSYFLTFPDSDTRLELMHLPGVMSPGRAEIPVQGYCHMAISLGSAERVDEMTALMRREGVTVIGNPRTTGDGYYESVIADPEGNMVELTV